MGTEYANRSCVQCERFVGWLDDSEEKEYQTSGLCPICFKEAMKMAGEIQPNLTMNNWAAILKLVRREIRNREAFGPEVLKGRDVSELRDIENAIVGMAFERAKGGDKDDKA